MVKPKVLKMKQCIENPNELKWDEFWAYELKQKEDRGKDWDKAAAGFHKRAKKDDYHDLLFSKLILDENDSVLDLGCGEGSITLPLAKKVKKVTGVDSSTKMLELLNQRAQEEDFDNIETILKPLEEANKYVFITLFGPENWKIEGNFNEYIGKENKHFPGHDYLFNILFNIGIYANVERLDIKAYREYDTIEEAMDNGKFRLDLLNDEEKDKLKEYLKKILTKNPETGKLYNKKDKADWILIWWKKD